MRAIGAGRLPRLRDCSGLARIDFLMEPATKGNSKQSQRQGQKKNPGPASFSARSTPMPGFTSISM